MNNIHKYRFYDIQESKLGKMPFKEEWLNEEWKIKHDKMVKRGKKSSNKLVKSRYYENKKTNM